MSKGNPKRIAKEVLAQMIARRKQGASYEKIAVEFGSTKWWCMRHLRDIVVEADAIEEDWRAAEREAMPVLSGLGYIHVVNLNQIAPQPYWDYYCEKDGDRWLIDVTTHSGKSLIEKSIRAVDGYRCAVLFRQNDKWKMLEILTRNVPIPADVARGNERICDRCLELHEPCPCGRSHGKGFKGHPAVTIDGRLHGSPTDGRTYCGLGIPG